MNNKRKLIIIIGSSVAALALLVATIFLIFYIKDATAQRKNQEIADKVIVHIEKLDDAVVTLDSEALISTVKAEYDLLTDEQKLLVTNYEILEKAINDLQNFKDQKAADELVGEIDEINEKTLAADDVTVSALLKKYDNLTDVQKSKVTNYDKLCKYKKIVDEKIEAQEKIDSAMKLAENFETFSGKWGDFGGHKDEYQGIVEKAIRKEVGYRKFFSTAVDSLEFNITSFHKDESAFNIGICYYSFTGISKEFGYQMTLYGEVIIKKDGSIYCTESGSYSY